MLKFLYNTIIMNSKVGNSRLLASIWLLSGGCIIAIKNLISKFVEINDFTSGFFDGLAVSFAMSGVIYLFFLVRKKLLKG